MQGVVVTRPRERVRFARSIAQMYHLRAEVFGTRLNWDVACVDGEERDEFDELDPVYVMIRSASGQVEASCRLLPTTGPYMLKDVFPQLLGGREPPRDELVWEVSRFIVVPSDQGKGGLGSIHRITQELLIQLIAVGLTNNLSSILAVTEVRFERVLRRAGLMMERYCAPMPIGDTRGVAGWTPVTLENLAGLMTRHSQLLRDDAHLPTQYEEEAA